MNIFNMDILAESEFGGILQFVIAIAIVVISIVTSKKTAQKKKEEHEQKRQQIKIAQPVSYESSNRYQNQQTQQKFWGVKLDEVDESSEKYIEIDDDDYDPLESQPVRRFASKVYDETSDRNERFGSLEQNHLISDIEQDSLQSDIEMQKFISDLDNLGELPDNSDLISDGSYDDDESEVSIHINVAKGSPEAFVHAIVLGEIFGPPMSMREPYAPKADEESFKKSTLL